MIYKFGTNIFSSPLKYDDSVIFGQIKSYLPMREPINLFYGGCLFYTLIGTVLKSIKYISLMLHQSSRSANVFLISEILTIWMS